jgi:hypothetical protein
MQDDLQLPREEVIDLAILLEEALITNEDVWYTGDQVMDLHHLKNRLKEQEQALDNVLSRIRLQGTGLVLTGPQKRELRKEALGVVAVCMNILQATQLLDPELEL